jgi:hypothetical protein
MNIHINHLISTESTCNTSKTLMNMSRSKTLMNVSVLKKLEATRLTAMHKPTIPEHPLLKTTRTSTKQTTCPAFLQHTVRSDQSIPARSKPSSIHRTPATRSHANQPNPTHHTDLHHKARRVDTPRARADRREEREERRGTLTWDRMKAIGSEPGGGRRW